MLGEKQGLSGGKTLKTGTTIVGLTFDGGIVLGADTRATAGTVADKNCEKIHYIAPNIYCCGAGTAADTEMTTAMVRRDRRGSCTPRLARPSRTRALVGCIGPLRARITPHSPVPCVSAHMAARVVKRHTSIARRTAYPPLCTHLDETRDGGILGSAGT